MLKYFIEHDSAMKRTGDIMMNLILARIGKHETIRYAFDELAKYLKQMDPTILIDARVYDKIDPTRKDILWVGLDGSIPASDDDSILIDIANGSGIITGSNERSVLMAVYRMLFALGCRWVYPGKNGERIPSVALTREMLTVRIHESPSYRHRGICIEGEVNCEHVYHTIEWLPKVGMNSYYIQFQTPGEFFKRWYNNARPSTIPNAPVSDDDVDHIVKRLEEEIVKRSLQYQAVGHSWTCEPFDVHCTDWAPVETIPASIAPYLAVLDGERKFWNGQPINSNLCFSQPIVRETIADAVVRYCQNHPEITHMHVWLGDGENNNCECDECAKMRPADYYVMLLNDLDKKLTELHIDVKIIFLVYVDLLWAPEHIRFENPDRFILMFAPLTRPYNKAFADYDKAEESEIRPYVRNKLVFPKKVGENIAMLKSWQKHFGGDSFDFDYHLYEAQYADPGCAHIAKILHLDMANLAKIGLNGMISCQVNQAAFPTGVAAYVMAKTLWNKDSDFGEICDEYYTADFGELGSEVEAYLQNLSELLDLYKFEDHKNKDMILADCAAAKALIKDFSKAFIGKYQKKHANWNYLMHHAKMCLLYCDLIVACALHDDKTKEKLVQKQRKYISEHKHELYPVFDTNISRHTAVLNHVIRAVQ